MGERILNVLSTITDNLDTYQGRDTAITLMHYIPLIIADACTYFSLSCGHMSENFVNMYLTLANCRVMLRLFDDFNAIREFYRFKKIEHQVIKLIISRIKRIIIQQLFFNNYFIFKLSLSFYLKWLNIVNLLFWVSFKGKNYLFSLLFVYSR
jgi:hypothetical protein